MREAKPGGRFTGHGISPSTLQPVDGLAHAPAAVGH
jgi:hypothetical protein